MPLPKPVGVHPGETGGNDLVGRGDDIIGYKSSFQGPGRII